MRYKLNHQFSFLYNLILKINFIFSLGFITYSILMQELPAIFFSILFSSWVFFLNRKFTKFKTIEFDKNNIYFHNVKIDLKDIEKIGLGKITFKINLKHESINFFYLPLFHENFDLLNKFHQDQLKSKER